MIRITQNLCQLSRTSHKSFICIGIWGWKNQFFGSSTATMAEEVVIHDETCPIGNNNIEDLISLKLMFRISFNPVLVILANKPSFQMTSCSACAPCTHQKQYNNQFILLVLCCNIFLLNFIKIWLHILHQQQQPDGMFGL